MHFMKDYTVYTEDYISFHSECYIGYSGLGFHFRMALVTLAKEEPK